MPKVINDIWGEEAMLHLRILEPEDRPDRRIVEICNCGMSGNCTPLGRITIAKHNLSRIAVAIATPATTEDK